MQLNTLWVYLLQTSTNVAVAPQCAVTSVRTLSVATVAPVPRGTASSRVAGSVGVSNMTSFSRVNVQSQVCEHSVAIVAPVPLGSALSRVAASVGVSNMTNLS